MSILIQTVAQRQAVRSVGGQPCKGMNCGTTTGTDHSLECQAEHAAAIAGGRFVKPLTWGDAVQLARSAARNANTVERAAYKYLQNVDVKWHPHEWTVKAILKANGGE